MNLENIPRNDLENIPNRDWNKQLLADWVYRGNRLRIFSVEPQAHLIAYTQTTGLLQEFTPDAVLAKAFQKNYHTEVAKPKVVENYGFEQKHSEPIELLDYVFECIYDRACEAEMNRYRHNSKNYESGRYTDYIKHRLCVVLPEDIYDLWVNKDPGYAKRLSKFVAKVKGDLEEYVDVVMDATNLPVRERRQAARRRLGEYRAVEGVYKANLLSLWHMATQRSHELSPNGIAAEPEISRVVTAMIKAMLPQLPVYANALLKQIAKGYR